MADDPDERLRGSTPAERDAVARAPVSCGPPSSYPWVVRAGVLLFAGVGAGISISSVRTGRPPLLFTAAWLAAAGWNAYWFLLRVCSRVTLDADGLTWSTPLRSGRVPLAEVTRYSRAPLGTGAQLLRSRSGPTLVVITRHGFDGFAETLQERAPHAEVRVPTTRWWSAGPV